MRAEDGGMRYLSPMVKQDLAKLDADGESRRIALKSLQLLVEQLDVSSMPRFLNQIGESRESGGSRSYAISLYEEVAKVHGKLIVSHIPRVMVCLIRSLSASGSSPQLQQACAKVTSALSMYTIDSMSTLEEAEDTIREICDPLTEVLAGKLEPMAAGAAACIHALVETENWKYACNDTVHEVCQRTTVALSEKSTRTVVHIQLACALASLNPDTLAIYGASLLRAGEEILKFAADSWQHRKAAARLLQGVLTVLGKETLETELDSALHALESCRLDKMPHVRAAVCEALHTAKLLASGDSPRTPVGMMPNSMNKSTERVRTLWSKVDVSILPASKQAVSPTSQESNQFLLSPASTSTTESMHLRQSSSSTRSSSSRKSKRAPLYPARGIGFTQSPRCSTSSTSSSRSITETLDTKENMPSRSTGVNGVITLVEELGHDRGHTKHMRPRAPVTVGACTPLLPSQLDRYGTRLQLADKDAQELAANVTDLPGPQESRGDAVVSTHMTPLVSAILNELDETATSIIAEDDAGLAQIDSEIEAFRINSGFGKKIEVVFPRLRLGSFNSPNSSSQSEDAITDYSSCIVSSTSCRSAECAKSGPNGAVGVAERNVGSMAMPKSSKALALAIEGSDENTLRGRNPHEQVGLTHHYNALAHLDTSPEEKSKSLITAKDFLPFSTPKRLMRALQSANSSGSETRGNLLEHDMKLSQDDGVPSGSTTNQSDTVDMDVETSSEAGWSVRDNPIASDESFQADSSDEELEKRHTGLYEAFAYPRKVASADTVSPRDIHVVSPANHMTPLVGEAELDHREGDLDPTLGSLTTPRAASSQRSSRIESTDQTCSACSVNFQKLIPWKMWALGRATKDFRFDCSKPVSSGLSTLLHEEVEGGLSCVCVAAGASGGSVTGESADEEEVDSLMVRTSSEKKRQRWWNQGIRQYLALRLVAKNWRKVCMYAEIALGGSLCVILALPLAMAVAKALTAPRQYHLVPT